MKIYTVDEFVIRIKKQKNNGDEKENNGEQVTHAKDEKKMNIE